MRLTSRMKTSVARRLATLPDFCAAHSVADDGQGVLRREADNGEIVLVLGADIAAIGQSPLVHCGTPFPSFSCLRRSWPQLASISPPRVRRTVAGIPACSQLRLEGRNSSAGAGLERALLDMVQGDEIDMGGQAVEQANQMRRHLRRVIHAADHGVFKADAAARFCVIVPAGSQQRGDGIPAIDRHDRAADLVQRRVQGDGKRQLQILLGQTPDLRHQAAG